MVDVKTPWTADGKPDYRVCGLRHRGGVTPETGGDAERGNLSS